MPAAAFGSGRRRSGRGTTKGRVLPSLGILVAAVSVLGCGGPQPPPGPSESEIPTESAAPDAAAATTEALRVPAGTVLRARPEADAEALVVLREDAVLAVEEAVGEWSRVRVPREASDGTEGGGRGWLRATDLERVEILRADGPREARALDPEVARVVRETLGDRLATGRCGPYDLWGDAEASVWSDLCARIATAIEEGFAAWTGLEPVGEPRGTVVMFSRGEDVRRFRDRASGVRVGVSAWADPRRGLLVVARAGRDDADVVASLAHEMVHWLQDRALGPGLRPWLAEGLAEVLGDAVGPGGELDPGLRPARADPHRRRLREALRTGRELEWRSVLSKGAGEFDRRAGDLDYERSVHLVRWLLDAGRRDTFRAFLAAVAGGRPADAETLLEHLGSGMEQLEVRLRGDLEA